MKNPWSERKGENTHFTNNVDKKSVKCSGPTVGSQNSLSMLHQPLHSVNSAGEDGGGKDLTENSKTQYNQKILMCNANKSY